LIGFWFCLPYKFDKSRGEAFIFTLQNPYFIGVVNMKFS